MPTLKIVTGSNRVQSLSQFRYWINGELQTGVVVSDVDSASCVSFEVPAGAVSLRVKGNMGSKSNVVKMVLEEETHLVFELKTTPLTYVILILSVLFTFFGPDVFGSNPMVMVVGYGMIIAPFFIFNNLKLDLK